ncbi:low-density lipoprotein receptor-related protein 8-like isoform X1 [Mya arenaria]|uniref:low-density lipoprotein receptor-related protein 8-like isoform X1 n=1 Tax=Mya arenaria TaxID=6604 RepID=UPI0022E6E53E|nr:low-density lipoprotein receptor-related protein 8-like isoform X1 [Mya arenaria]
MSWIQFCLIAFFLPWIVQLFDDSARDRCLERDKFYCNISGRCIYKSTVCDGFADCKEGEDESPPACTMDKCLQRGSFYCNTSERCILQSLVCDGVTDCKEREDEYPPACTEDECFRNGRSLCFGSLCIHTSSLMDGKVNCPRGEDERPKAWYLRHYCDSNRSLSRGCLGECKLGKFDKYCGITCFEKCSNGSCDKSSGRCNMCASGYHGKYCQKTCSEECLNGICNKSSGICKTCTRTYLENCSQECGKECLEINGFPQCDRESGKCLNGCNLYHYGHYCNNSCKNCKGNYSNIPCDINGVCQFGCENDYWDKTCNSKCSANCQGDEHGKRCNSSTGECINGCTRGWSGKLCGDPTSLQTTTTESNDKVNVSSLNTIVIVIPVLATVVVVVVGIICYFWGRKRFNRQQNERIEPRREFRFGVAPRQRPSGSRRRQSSTLYADINEETMEHYHYICEQNPPDHYDKIKDRKPCICPQCVRERVDPILQRISSGSSSTTFVEPYATCGWGIGRTSSIHSYISNRELNTRRNVPTNDSDSGIVPTKELTDDRKPGRSTSHSAGDLAHVCKTDYTNGVNPRPCVAKSKSCIELVCTHEYLDLEELYQTAKAEDRRKLAAKYFDEGEDVFGVIGQFQAKDSHYTETEESEVLNQLDNQNLALNIESSLVIGRSEQIEESCSANDIDFIVEQQPAQSQNDAKMDDPKDTDGMDDSDEIKQTDSLV